MPTRRMSLLLVAPALACKIQFGPSATDGASGDPPPGTSDETTASPTSAPTSTGPGDTTDAADTGTGGATDSGGSGTTGGSSGAPTTGPTGSAGDDTGTTGAAGDVQYAAYFKPADDSFSARLVIRKADFTADRCTTVELLHMGAKPPPAGFELDLPAMWQFFDAKIVAGATPQCLDEDVGFLDSVDPDGASGEASWDGVLPGRCPATIAVDIALTFPQGEPWVPATDAVQSGAIPLQGC